MFHYALITADGEALGEVAFAVGSWKAGDVIPQGPGRNLRVTAIVHTGREEDLPLLVVEPA